MLSLTAELDDVVEQWCHGERRMEALEAAQGRLALLMAAADVGGLVARRKRSLRKRRSPSLARQCARHDDGQRRSVFRVIGTLAIRIAIGASSEHAAHEGGEAARTPCRP
jgi:hypothetical protein